GDAGSGSAHGLARQRPPGRHRRRLPSPGGQPRPPAGAGRAGGAEADRHPHLERTHARPHHQLRDLQRRRPVRIRHQLGLAQLEHERQRAQRLRPRRPPALPPLRPPANRRRRAGPARRPRRRQPGQHRLPAGRPARAAKRPPARTRTRDRRPPQRRPAVLVLAMEHASRARAMRVVALSLLALALVLALPARGSAKEGITRLRVCGSLSCRVLTSPRAISAFLSAITNAAPGRAAPTPAAYFTLRPERTKEWPTTWPRYLYLPSA